MFLSIIIIAIDNKRFNGPYTGSLKLPSGQYYIVCHGAQGGHGYHHGTIKSYGGKGAYASGIIDVKGTGTLFYINVGGMGGYESVIGPNHGGFNGGGKGGKDVPDPSGYSDAPGGGNDASGGGGGATDLRIYNNNTANRIIVAAGGSGAAFTCNGAPGGDYYGFIPSSSQCDDYKRVETVSETQGNANGVGSNGRDFHAIPGSGAGGGYRGGLSRNYDALDENDCHLVVGTSGSSYVSGHPNFTPHPLMTLSITNILFGNYEDFGNTGNGSMVITTNYQCSSYCSECTSDTMCLTCFSTAYKYKNACYLNCGDLNKPSQNSYYGKNDVTKTCNLCSVKLCKDCLKNYRVCNECIKGFHLEGNKCVHDPTDVFTKSKIFSPSLPFTNSKKFSPSLKFTKSAEFTKSDEFSYSLFFSYSNEFSSSLDFSYSDKFSKSDDFSPSSRLTESMEFSSSLRFTESVKFSHSSHFTLTNGFSLSSNFSFSIYFTHSNSFSLSSLFSNSNVFSSSACFSKSLEFIIQVIKDPDGKKKLFVPIIATAFGVIAAILLIFLIILFVKRKNEESEPSNQAASSQESKDNDSMKEVSSPISVTYLQDRDLDFWL